MTKKVTLKIIKNNMNIQKRLNININNYKDFSEKFSSIELEIIPIQNKHRHIINVQTKDTKYFHFYLNDNKEENKINNNDKISKINIIIDYQIKSFKDLFYYCECIESINFKKFYRNNITSMIAMFLGCKSLIELNITNFNTNNAINIRYIFYGCSSLKELIITNFNTPIL